MTARLTVIGIAVRDMGRSLEFYRLLGLDIAPDQAGEAHVEAELEGGITLMFDTDELMASFDAAYAPASGRGRISLAFACGSPADVDSVHETVVAAGHTSHLAPFDAPWRQRYASVHDPDGNSVDLFAPLDDDPSTVLDST
ncbi:MAG: VOC family protein [Acidimicrobiia bacterium]